ncbi:hypothetical protein BDZ89DRAFT_1233208 [Hymenopellis radicata]|nr:hypothetical protein BDZ89DRAFT_1233208 [Hymenopellis radicata]
MSQGESSGRVECPDCGEYINVGAAGAKALDKIHRGKKSCSDNQKRRNAKRNQPSLMSMFAKQPKAKPTVPLVKAPPPIQPRKATSGPSTSRQSPTSPFSSSQPRREGTDNGPTGISILDTLRARIQALSDAIPEATSDDELAAFCGDPPGGIIVNDPLEAWEIWDPPLNTLLQRSPNDLQMLVKRGQYGIRNLYHVFRHVAVDLRVDVGLLEGKINRVIDAIDAPMMPEGADNRMDIPLDIPGPIDVDALPSRETTPIPTSSSHAYKYVELNRACPGVTIDIPEGQSAHSMYPFGLHDKFGDPWDYSVRRGVMSVFAPTCRVLRKNETICPGCSDLHADGRFSGIQNRINNGVHENTGLAYHGIASLQTLTRRKQGQIRALRLQKLNDTRKLAGKQVALDAHKEWMMAIGSGKVERVDKLVKVGLRRGAGVKGLLKLYDRAARGVYRPRSYTEEDDYRALLMWRLGGTRVATIAHRALDMPSVDVVRRRTLVPPIHPSPYFPAAPEIRENVVASFAAIKALLEMHKVVHQVIMLDELKVESRLRWYCRNNFILGVCREHGSRVCLEFKTKEEVHGLIDAVAENKVHIASEATVGAIGLLSRVPRLYNAHPVLISASCKKETGTQHAKLIAALVDASKDTTIRTVSIASDGEARRGTALVQLTFKHPLNETSPIYPHVGRLPLMNLEVGDDDVTCDKDYKHVIKRFRNLLLRESGTVVHGVHITLSVIRSHLAHNNISMNRINDLLKPDDRQDVKLSYDLLREIWLLPEALPTDTPTFTAARKSLRTLGSLFRHILLPYVCIDLTLSEQLVHLSAAAHTVLALWIEDGVKTRLMPSQLYIDLMIMVKNTYFCVAKVKVDDPKGGFWIILLGTDRLEILFGIVRTMVGNDANLDVLQLGDRITSATEVSAIFAKYPHWDKPPRRLNLPMLSKDELLIPGSVDHLTPSTWRGNVDVENVVLLTCWNSGRRLAEDNPHLKAVLARLLPGANILRPFAVEMVKSKRTDIDDTIDDSETARDNSLDPTLEDAVGEEEAGASEEKSLSPLFEFDGKQVYKARYLKEALSQFREAPNSRDRLKRVASVPRYAIKQDSYIPPAELTETSEDANLTDSTCTVKYQLLHLTGTSDDEAEGQYDWKWSMKRGETYSVPGRLVHPYSPAVSTRTPGKPTWVFESPVLRALGMSMLDDLAMQDSALLPEVDPTPVFPYLLGGKACFVCENDGKEREIVSAAEYKCTHCQPPVPLPKKDGPRTIEHAAAHQLFDSQIDRAQEPCGLCLRPAGVFDWKKSTCANQVNFSYARAAASTDSSPCSNVPVRCPECNDVKAPAVWSYNMLAHLKRRHPHVDFEAYEDKYKIDDFEYDMLKNVWANRHKKQKKRKSKKKIATLLISEAHSSRLA